MQEAPGALGNDESYRKKEYGHARRRESVRGGTVYLSEGDLCSGCAATVRGRIGAIERADASTRDAAAAAPPHPGAARSPQAAPQESDLRAAARHGPPRRNADGADQRRPLAAVLVL